MTTDDNIITHKFQDPTFHISKAKRNERFYRKYDLEKSTFNEWAIVTLFYSSLHYVDAVLSQDTDLSPELRDPDNHLIRNEAVSKCKALLPIASKYLSLANFSRTARYKQTCFKEGTLNDIKVNLFKPIQDHVRGYLGISLEAES